MYSENYQKMQQIMLDFKMNVIDFLDELIEQFPCESDIIFARLVLNDRISPEKIINNFILEAMPFKEAIAKRDEAFFLENNFAFFSNVNKSTVNHFKVLWKSSFLDDDDRQVVWKWFDTFIYLAEQYQKYKMESIETKN